MRLLFVGDVVGGLGRRTLAAVLPGLIDRHQPDFVVANSENAAGGVGITERTALAVFDAGVDAITLGNHAFRHTEVYGFLDRDERIVRPANYPKGSPGRGLTVIERDGMALGIVNLSGTAFLDAARSPFPEADAAVADLRGRRDPRAGGHARGGHEREGCDGLAPRRARHGVPGHPHARAHRGCPRAAGRHRLLHRRGHDGPARGRHRREARASARAVLDDDGGPVRERPTEDPWLNAVLVEAGADGHAVSIEQILEPGPPDGRNS